MKPRITVFISILISCTIASFLYWRSEEQKWKRWFDEHEGNPPRQLALDAIALFDSPGTILSLGSGVGNDEVLMVQQGWQVDCVEPSEYAIDLMFGRLELQGKEYQLRVFNKSFENLDPIQLSQQYDLVYAGYSLPFTTEETLKKFLPSILRLIRKEGIFAAHFFSKGKVLNAKNTNYQTTKSIKAFLSGFEIIKLRKTADHSIEVIARKSS